eukprot:994144-Prymnesium_polylepis.1
MDGRHAVHHAATAMGKVPEGPMRVLTVGDGDLSYSLALARAFGARIQLTATVLVPEEELVATYAAAGRALAELRQRGVRFQAGVDATALQDAEPPIGPQDHIVFNHPHLGLADLTDEAAHARRHGTLISHYLHSAAAMLAAGGLVHLTLCGHQPSTWQAEPRGARVGLSLVQARATTAPQCFVLPAAAAAVEGLAAAEPEWRAGRRYRNGALGSKHWLGKYGYEHRRCEGDAAMNVENSVELIFGAAEAHAEPSPSQSPPPPPPPPPQAPPPRCVTSFIDSPFSSRAEYEAWARAEGGATTAG